MNSFTGIGRIGKDAQVRYTQSGAAVTGWSVAIDTGFGDKKTTTWLDCSAWGERFTKVAEYIRKGDRIGVTGEIGTREHDGKTYVTLNVRDVTLLGDKREAGAQKSAPAPSNEDPNDEIPF
jgi:single-strand DNA-binding protein